MRCQENMQWHFGFSFNFVAVIYLFLVFVLIIALSLYFCICMSKRKPIIIKLQSTALFWILWLIINVSTVKLVIKAFILELLEGINYYSSFHETMSVVYSVCEIKSVYYMKKWCWCFIVGGPVEGGFLLGQS